MAVVLPGLGPSPAVRERGDPAQRVGCGSVSAVARRPIFLGVTDSAWI
jgi:hypothetical protein